MIARMFWQSSNLQVSYTKEILNPTVSCFTLSQFESDAMASHQQDMTVSIIEYGKLDFTKRFSFLPISLKF